MIISKLLIIMFTSQCYTKYLCAEAHRDKNDIYKVLQLADPVFGPKGSLRTPRGSIPFLAL